MTNSANINSETVTNEVTFSFTLEINEDNEILFARQITYHCSECGEAAIVSDNLDEPAYCEEHPSATIDSIVSDVTLLDTPTGLGDDSDTDVVFFTPESDTLAGSFGLQTKHENGKLKAICDLDGETLSSSATWIIPNKVPAAVAIYAEALCS